MAKKQGDKSATEKDMVALNARIPSDLYRRLGRAKYDTGKDIQEMVAEALEKFLSSVETKAQESSPKPSRK